MLISNHKSLAEQLVACDITTVLRKCLSGHSSESMLAIIALTHISNVHKLERKGSIKREELVRVQLLLKCCYILTCEQTCNFWVGSL